MDHLLPSSGPPDDALPENDPDRDFDEKNEDYLEYIIAKLQAARAHTHRIKEQAAQMLSQTRQEEKALWLSSESYLTEATRWHTQKTGQTQLRKPSGSLSVGEEPAAPEITEEARLTAWVQSRLTALLALAAALSEGKGEPIPTARGPSSPPTPAEAVAAFYRTTELLPDGCQMGPPRTVLRLD